MEVEAGFEAIDGHLLAGLSGKKTLYLIRYPAEVMKQFPFFA
jgi:hypothetical protein